MMRPPTLPEQERRRVLVIAYYFPPMGFSGVQRISKFVKYLPSFGWDVSVLTVHPAGYFAYDQSLLDDLRETDGITIYRTASLDPTRLFGRQKVVPISSEQKRRLLSELSQWFLFPDNKIGWLPYALRQGSSVLSSMPHEAIISTAPPYTSHLIAASLSRRFQLPLLLDYRDDWLGNPRHVYPSRLHSKLHRMMEHWAAAPADDIVTINGVISRSLSERLAQKVSVLDQGFDPDDFLADHRPDPGTFKVTYTGVFYDAQRPDVFLHACARFLKIRPHAREHLKLDFAGLLPDDASLLARRLGLADYLTFHGYLPHDAAVRLQQESDVLWLTIGRRDGAEAISTGKLFEYIGARRPILALVPDGAAGDLLKAYNLATISDPDNEEDVARALVHLYDEWRSDAIKAADEDFVNRFDRKALTGRLADRLNRIAPQKHRDPA